MAESFTLDLTNINNRILSGAIELSHGEPFTITGSGFGTKAGYWDFLDQSPIMTDQATYPIGSNFGRVGRWSGTNFIGASNRPIISATGGVAGEKCLFWNHLAPATNNCLQFYYDVPVPLGTTLYFTRWIKHRCVQPTVLGGQIKSDRWQAVTNSLSDKPNETYKNMYIIAATDNKIQVRDANYPSAGNSAVLHSGDSEKSFVNKNRWMRNDVRIKIPSAYANPSEYMHEEWFYDPDGILLPSYRLYTNNQAVDHASPFTDASSLWNMHLMQNYIGSGGGGDFSSLDHEMWYSKVAEMVGDDVRLEFGSTQNDVRSPIQFMCPLSSLNNTTANGLLDAGNLTFGYLKVIRNETILKSVPVRVV